MESFQIAEIEKLTELVTLKEIAITSRHPDLAKAAVYRLVNLDALEVLEEVAKSDAFPEVRFEVVKNISDQTVLKRIALAASYILGSLIVRKLTDTDILKEIAIVADSAISLLAVDRLDDQEILKDIAVSSYSPDARKKAIRKLLSEDVLKELSQKETNTKVMLELINQISNQSILMDIISRTEQEEIKKKAAGKITDQAFLSKLSETETERAVLYYVALNSNDQSALINAIKKCNDRNVCETAIKKITDHNVLTDILLNSNQYGVEALENMSDREVLTKVAESHSDLKTRMKAYKKLGSDERAYLEWIRFRHPASNWDAIPVPSIYDKEIFKEIILSPITWMHRSVVFERFHKEGCIYGRYYDEKIYNVLDILFSFRSKQDYYESEDRRKAEKIGALEALIEFLRRDKWSAKTFWEFFRTEATQPHYDHIKHSGWGDIDDEECHVDYRFHTDRAGIEIEYPPYPFED